MIKTITRTILFTAMSVSLVLAQRLGGPDGHPPGDPPDPATMIQRRVDSLTTLLTLTDTQKTQATKIFTDAQTSGSAVQTTLSQDRQSIRDAVKKNDVPTINTLSATVGTLTGQLTAIQSKADAAFYALLTPDQQTKFDELRGPGDRGGFPGGLGRPGPY